MRSGSMRALGLWLGLALALGLGAGSAQAAQMQGLSGAADLSCMTRPDKGPAFPDRDRETRRSAYFRVQLTFTGANDAPDEKFLFVSGTSEMQNQVEDYLRKFRLPCLRAGSTATVVQEVEFKGLAPDSLRNPIRASGR